MKKFILAVSLLSLLTTAAYSANFSDNYRRASRFPLHPGYPGGGTDEDTTIFHSTFENGMEGWTTQDLTIQTNHWNPDAFNAFQGNSWWCGDSSAGGSGIMGYDNFWLQYMDSPVLNLSGAVNPTLTFKVYYSIEDYAAVPPPPPYNGWDGCNVWISVNGGASFTPITPVSPAYNCTSLSSFGTVWRMGPNIPGWAGQSNGWLDAQFNLSSYAVNNVVIRFALASDRAVASSTGHPELLGFFVDDVLVSAGANTYLSNNGDDVPVPGPFTFSQGAPFGDHWTMTTATSYSPSHCMVVDDDFFFINNALISPPIQLPDDYTLWFKYAVLCDLPDSTHGTSTSLRDYYFVDLTADGGVTWENQFYDYARGYCFPNWGVCAPDTPFTPGGNTAMDLSQWGGQTIQLRFRCTTDGDHTTGNGSGLHIDDLWIIGSNMLADDCGPTSLHIPFPTTMGFQIPCSVVLNNFGLNPQSQVPAFFRAGTSIVPMAPWIALPGDTSYLFNFNWTPPAEGTVDPYVYTAVPGDLNPANDTTWAGEVLINEANLYELGYDNRLPEFFFEFNSGEGPLVKFSAPFETTNYFMLTQIRVLFNGDLPSDVQFTAHFYNEGTAVSPGTEFRTETFTVSPTQTYPNWWEGEIAYVPGTTTYSGDVWLWLEMTEPNALPHPIGHYRQWGEGHYYSFDGTTAVPYNDDLMIRLLIQEAGFGEVEIPAATPIQFALHPVYPNPFNSSVSIAFDLPETDGISLKVFDISGREVQDLGFGIWDLGTHSVVWDAEDCASGVYFIRLEAGDYVKTEKIVLMK